MTVDMKHDLGNGDQCPLAKGKKRDSSGLGQELGVLATESKRRTKAFSGN